MPHPNRSPSSPGLRDPPKQAADELRLPRRLVPRSKSFRYTILIRTFSSRPPRPTVASIADLFASSLVLAGFCHEHSPRNRRLSTMPSRISEQHLREYHYNPVNGRDQKSIKRRLEYSRSSTQRSRSRSWLSTAQVRNEGLTFDQNYTCTSLENDTGDNANRMLSGKKEDADGRSHEQSEDPRPLSISPSKSNSHLESKRGDPPPMAPEAEGELNDASTPEDKRSLSYDEQNYIAISRLYQRILGNTFDWKEAAETMLSMPQPKHGLHHDRDEIERPSVARLVEVRNGDTFPTTQQLFRLYREIPTPGVAKLSKYSRGYLLRRLASPPNRRWADARRYLALVDDMVSAALPMSRALWSTAIHFAGRGTGNGRVLKRDLVRAIGLWQQMEHVAGIPADHVVFNILFDVAVKSGQYTVASRLEDEMKSRGISFSRFGMVSKIFYHGLRKDLHALSRTFEEFVKSGEIVDTVVLNSLCTSYLRAGATDLAEQVYTRMMENTVGRKHGDTTNESEPVLSPEHVLYRRKNQRLARLLKHARYLHRRLPEHHRSLQNSLPMTPDTRTFYIFLRHYALQAGHFHKFKSIVSDMENIFDVPPRNLIFMLLFEGFGLHGGHKKTWSAERLRQVWFAYLRALRDSKTRLDNLSKGIKSSTYEWENPLAPSVTPGFEVDLPESDPGGFYMPLPSVNTEDASIPPDTLDSIEDPGSTQEFDRNEETQNAPETETETNGTINIYERENVFVDDQWNLEIDPGFQHLEYLQKRVENGVFVGRKMIIVILRAFGACCGPNEVLEVWLQLERLWHPDHRKAQDVFAVKEELDRQLSKDSPRHVR